jgi:hypothetical protein
MTYPVRKVRYLLILCSYLHVNENMSVWHVILLLLLEWVFLLNCFHLFNDLTDQPPIHLPGRPAPLNGCFQVAVFIQLLKKSYTFAVSESLNTLYTKTDQSASVFSHFNSILCPNNTTVNSWTQREWNIQSDSTILPGFSWPIIFTPKIIT